MPSKEFNRFLRYSHVGPNGDIIETSTNQDNPFQKEIDEDNIEKTVPLIKKFLDEENTCNISGFVDITKVKGDVLFQVERYSKAF